MTERETLSPRELQVLELLAWGAQRKEIPGALLRLYGGKEISINTVNNIVANIYSKLSLQNEKELSAWYFCEYYGVPREESPLKRLRRTVYSILFLVILLPQISDLGQMLRPAPARVCQTARTARANRPTGRTYRMGGRRKSDD